jgi:DNA-directed RNA polymerase subunit RPC12/RpoP
MTIPLKNPTLYTKTFSCLCSQCRTEFVIAVDPTSTGKATCPSCGSEKIFAHPDNIKGDLDLLDY